MMALKEKRLFTLPLFLVLAMKQFHSLTMTCSNVNCLQVLLVVFVSWFLLVYLSVP